MMPNNKSTSTFLSSVPEYLVSPSSSGSSGSNYSASSLLFCLSLLKDKVNELQNLVGVIVSPHQQHTLPNSSSSSNNYSMAISSMNSTIQEIIVAANSMMLSLGSTTTTTPGTNSTTCTDQQLHHQQNQSNNIVNNDNNNNNRSVLSSSNMCPDNNIIREHSFFSTIEAEALDWFPSVSYNNNNKNISDSTECNIGELPSRKDDDEIDIIELDAADLLARYTHFCHVCGKGFKRDANLRMHMRAHGDEYKTTQALSNPMKNKGSSSSDGNCLMMMMMSSSNSSKKAINDKRYSCPHEGCRWNKKHAKFQPLKSMVCVKNHYKRTHCPKMYVCKRCNVKQFSVLSDLKTHEKHCGDPKWQCSCGTTFSRKDKLMGHVALFVGHTPLTPVISDGMASFSSGKLEQQALQQQIDGSSR